MGNCRGERAICSRGWLAAPPLVLLPQQAVTELLEPKWRVAGPVVEGRTQLRRASKSAGCWPRGFLLAPASSRRTRLSPGRQGPRAVRLLFFDPDVISWREAARGAQLAGTHAPAVACTNSAPGGWVATRRHA
jgi:hypothetical protein